MFVLRLILTRGPCDLERIGAELGDGRTRSSCAIGLAAMAAILDSGLPLTLCVRWSSSDEEASSIAAPAENDEPLLNASCPFSSKY